MAMEPVERMISKTEHWPLKDRRRYLILALETERGRWRRRRLSDALRGITTKVLKQEMRRKS